MQFDEPIGDSWSAQLIRKAARMFLNEVDGPMHGFKLAKLGPRNQLRVYCDKIGDRSLYRIRNSSGS